ncbi:MAG: hypothetical protein KTR24_18295, partial [Saprospiraceae bacterium]|nr:hypothetical protein [Saprospiraceae bacterium]
MRKIKICYWLHEYISASETFILSQMEHFRMHHHVQVLCFKNFTAADGIVEMSLPHKWIRYLNAKLHYFPMVSGNLKRTARDRFEKEDYDVLHCHFGLQALSLLDNYVPRNMPIFISFHGYDITLILEQSWLYR